MQQATLLPATGEVFLDDRGGLRSLRVSWHHDQGMVVLSLWRGADCAGTFRMRTAEVPDLIDALRAGLDAAYSSVRLA